MQLTIAEHHDTDVPPEASAPFPPMPLVCSSFKPGECRMTIEAMENETSRAFAWAEYGYFRGEPEKSCKMLESFLDHPDPALRLPALLIYCFDNLSLDRIHLAAFGLSCVREKTLGDADSARTPLSAMKAFVSEAASTLLHLQPSALSHSAEDAAPLIARLPAGLKLLSFYVQAHRAYMDGDYARSLGIVQTALSLYVETYPVPSIYLHLVAAMDLMSLRRPDEARDHFLVAWGLAKPDGLLQPIGEHHGLLQGLIEVCLKRDSPEDYERVIAITYRFSAGWRKLHALQTDESIADNLTTTEFTVAMLANRGWTNKEIAAHMGISANTVKHYVSAVYAKLGISNRRELKSYMLR